jgi:diphosphomevalonate decarboxylase
VKKSDIVRTIFQNKIPTEPQHEQGLAFAPTNIALCKYWGKRQAELNLPMTSSLSVSLPDKGALTKMGIHDKPHDLIILNDREVLPTSNFAKRTHLFLELFRPEKKWRLKIDISMDIPVAAGLASSACGFASLVLTLNDLFDWKISIRNLSILARLGSGSASRSLWTGFVEWQAGLQADGMDSYSVPLPFEWPELYIGILPLSYKEKTISSREAMRQTVLTSSLYGSWPQKVARDIVIVRQALHVKNFPLLGATVESNALAMHATIMSCWPPLCYFLPETIAAMHQIWELRRQGLELYFTEDAGPNLKLLFLKENCEVVKQHFPTVDIVKLFD